MAKIKVIDQDIVFLSYDEPNAEKNYADLCSKLPWAKRVHGVHGSDEALKACAIYARQIAKTYDCAVFYMSQLSAEAEGRAQLNQSMMEGSRTGKAAEADLMILIGKSPTVEGQEEDSPLRHINIVKNKLNGWHGMVNCELNYQTARYEL